MSHTSSPPAFPPPHERVARHCVCCASAELDRSPAVLMPFVAHRAFGWTPVEITEDWGLRSLRTGMAYTVCNSVQCRACGHLFLDIRFDDAEMSALYSGYREQAYTALREHYEPGYAARNVGLNAGVGHLAQIERFLAPHLALPPRVLDWGGDTGKNAPFKDHNALLHIYDISNKSELIDGAVAVSREQAFAQRYDLVVCSNVLEHIPYPSDMVFDMIKAMRPDTLLYIEVPQEELVRANAGAPGLLRHKRHWHEHINFYSEQSLRTLVGHCGLQVVDFNVQTLGDSHHLYQIACRLA